MLSLVATSILLAIVGDALPLNEATHSLDTRKSALTCPVSVQSANYLCDVKSSNTDTQRDLGFAGKIGGKTIHTYGVST